MIRSMFSAISGLRNHQTMMDVVGNNIANVNTNGFKSSSTVFEDVLSQTSRGAGQPSATIGGTNPNTIGLGSRVAGITTSFAQGSLQRTGRSTDFAIQGDGFFVVDSLGGREYTRAGSFSVDALGRITTNSGGFVQGWQADNTGKVSTTAPIGNITIPVGDLVPPVQTTTVQAGGNLPADAAVGTVLTNAADVFDGQGNPVSLRLEYTKTANNTWKVEARYVDSSNNLVPAPPAAGQAIAGTPLTFGADGEVTSGYNATIPGGFLPGFAAPITLNFGAAGVGGRINQFGEIASVAIIQQDGSSAGSLQSFSVSQEGLIVGTYSNGRTRAIGQMALATFSNPGGLEAAGGTAFTESVNSGLPQIGTAGGGAGRGLITAGTLEMSNVDLSQEFTNLIIAQRGFQANSRVITTSDELLQEVVNLKR
ncbi:MAG: flagellar hook protein FlgE [Acidimicrobiales bacterium]